MRRILAFALFLTAFTAPALGQDTVIPGTPAGWLFGGNYDKYEVGTRVLPRMRPGMQVAYIKAGPSAECGDFGALFQTIAANKYRGKRLKFSARLRGGAGMGGGTFNMFIFTSGPGDPSGVARPRWAGVSPFDRGNFRNESITIGVPANAEEITFGFRATGPRTGGNADTVRLEVMGDYQAAPPSSVPARRFIMPGWPNNTHIQVFHGSCAHREQWLTARGLYDLNERALTTLAKRPAPQGVQVALAAE